MSQRFYQKASVQVAMVSGLALLLATGITIWHQRSGLAQEHTRLTRVTREQAADIQRLETLLTPFRTIALEKFSGPEGEALQKLAERITTLDASLDSTKAELAAVKTAASYPKLRKIINIRPNGVEAICSGNRAGAHSEARGSSTVSAPLQEAFAALQRGDTSSATQHLRQITSEEPLWPYGHFYLGAITKQQSCFRQASNIFAQLREVDIVEPEVLLFEGLTFIFLGETERARASFSDLKTSKARPRDVLFMSLPPNTPADLVEEFNRLAEELKLNSPGESNGEK